MFFHPTLCDLNRSVRGRVSSSNKFRTPPNLNSEVSTPKILLFSSWYFMQIGCQESVGHLRTLSQRCPMLRIKVWRCPETRTRAGNSSSYWAIQNPPYIVVSVHTISLAWPIVIVFLLKALISLINCKDVPSSNNRWAGKNNIYVGNPFGTWTVDLCDNCEQH